MKHVVVTVIKPFALLLVISTLLSACGGDDKKSDSGSASDFTVTASAGEGGSISPDGPQEVSVGETIDFTVSADDGFTIGEVSGCGGSMSEEDNATYTTGEISENCEVKATFTSLLTVTAGVDGEGGSISPDTPQQVVAGETVDFTLTSNSGFVVGGVDGGCGGNLSKGAYDRDSNTYTYTYTTGAITGNCSVTPVFTKFDGPITPTLSFAPAKLLRFNWTVVKGATHYRLLENPDGISGFTQVGGDIKPKVEKLDHQVPLYARINARYILQSCVNTICYDSGTVSVSGTLVDSIGYVKASNSDGKNKGEGTYGDFFGFSVSLNATGDTLAVGADGEDSAATGINGDQSNADVNLDYNSGAVYVFTREGNGVWTQQAYIKASNTGHGDRFGKAVSLDNTGDTLAVGANGEDSGARGIDHSANENDNLDQSDNSVAQAGAVYVFTRDGEGVWSQQAYIKASNSDHTDDFGWVLSLSGNGDTLAVGSYGEQSNATGIDHSANENDNLDQENNDAVGYTGAVYVFTRSGKGVWSQQAYIKASNYDTDNIGVGDLFGYPVSLDDTGDTLAVGAYADDSKATGVHSSPFEAGNDNSIYDAGAVYVFTRNGESVWSQQAYIKASNSGPEDQFGVSLSLSGTGDTLAVGAFQEDSAATGIEGNQVDDCDTTANNCAADSGAVYVFTRDADGWSQQAYIKASNTEAGDGFGGRVSLDGTGDTLAVRAYLEDSGATGINGDQNDNSAVNSGAVYLFTRSAGVWSQRAYIKASNTEGADSSCIPTESDPCLGDAFGESLSLSGDGDTLAVGATEEDSNARVIDGDQLNNDANYAGAVYLY